MNHLKNKALLAALNDCVAACNYCSTACLDEDDVNMMANCIKSDTDCADICKLTATLVARGSVHAKHLLKECMEVCQACGAECEKHTHMQHCKECAEACRKCAEECRRHLQ